MVTFSNLPCNSHCYICGVNLDDYSGTRDHFIPKALHGSDNISNLRPACKLCNSFKNSYNPSLLLFITITFMTYTRCIDLHPGGYSIKAKRYELNEFLNISHVYLSGELSSVKIQLHIDYSDPLPRISFTLTGESSRFPVVLLRSTINDIIAVLQDSVEYYMLITKGVWPLDYWDDLLTPKPKAQEDSNMLNDLDYNNVDPLLISEKENNIVYHHLICSLCGSVSDIPLPNAKADVEIICPECLKVLNEFEVIPPIVKHLLRSRRESVDKIATTVSDISRQLKQCLG